MRWGEMMEEVCHTMAVSEKGRRPRYRFGGRVNVFCSGNVDSETMPTNVITY
jgi:hypothetical protein